MTDQPTGPFVCHCGKVWDTRRGLLVHTRQWCTGAPPQPDDAAPPTAAANADEEEIPGDKLREPLFKTAFKCLTRIRLKFNASNAVVQSVKDMVREMRSMELGSLAEQCHPTDFERLTSLLAVDPFSGLKTPYLEARARERLLPDLSPSRRVIGQRFESEEMNDGREIQHVIEDVNWDFDVMRHLEAMLEGNQDLCADFLAFPERMSQRKIGVIADVWDGVASKSFPLVLAAIERGEYPLMLQYYMDGIGFTGPLAIAATRNKAAASYVAVLNFSSGNRTSPHCIVPVGLCHEKDWSRYPEVDIVCGPIDEPADGTSLGAQMRRLANGAELLIPAAFASSPKVRWLQASPATGGRAGYFLRVSGGVMTTSVDSPAAGQVSHACHPLAAAPLAAARARCHMRGRC